MTIIKLSFTKKPIPLPAEYRPMYKIAMIVMILKYCCRIDTSSLLKLHLFSWALSSQQNMNELHNYIENNFKNDLAVWSIEPALNRALQLAIAENICEINMGKNYKLTNKGNIFFDMIKSEKNLFVIEKEFLEKIGKNKITDKQINSITQKWNLCYVEN